MAVAIMTGLFALAGALLTAMVDVYRRNGEAREHLLSLLHEDRVRLRADRIATYPRFLSILSKWEDVTVEVLARAPQRTTGPERTSAELLEFLKPRERDLIAEFDQLRCEVEVLAGDGVRIQCREVDRLGHRLLDAAMDESQRPQVDDIISRWQAARSDLTDAMRQELQVIE